MSAEIDEFLKPLGWAEAHRTPLPADASPRRYLRLHDRAGDQTAILMIAPPDEEFDRFQDIAAYLKAHGLSAPEILAVRRAAGLMLLEDLGDDLFARCVETDPQAERPLYTEATDLLSHLAGLPPPAGLPHLAPDRMCDMLAVTFEHLSPGADAAGLRQEISDRLLPLFRSHFGGPGVTILRDYHAENLIWLPGRQGLARVGLLDFQLAATGPAGYDLISLLDDARRDVPEPLRADLIARHGAALGLDPAAFRLHCALLSLQRNLRILGVFARLASELGKPGYLRHMPRVAGHVRRAAAHAELHALRAPVSALLDNLPVTDPVG
ncbi:phosphotransferase [Boseongicola sp. H5]|uniref:aminoglycoside phosphotransferase family protein n=1 Tax=Boseongicola sp. H5 TaxID=2763261 RepID=UPI001D0A4C0C|nr:phosphotransferase [Boseongicola sp. H5]